MKLNKKRSPHSLRKMDQGGKTEKPKYPRVKSTFLTEDGELDPFYLYENGEPMPFFLRGAMPEGTFPEGTEDLVQETSTFYRDLYSDPRVQSRVQNWFLGGEEQQDNRDELNRAYRAQEVIQDIPEKLFKSALGAASPSWMAGRSLHLLADKLGFDFYDSAEKMVTEAKDIFLAPANTMFKAYGRIAKDLLLPEEGQGARDPMNYMPGLDVREHMDYDLTTPEGQYQMYMYNNLNPHFSMAPTEKTGSSSNSAVRGYTSSFRHGGRRAFNDSGVRGDKSAPRMMGPAALQRAQTQQAGTFHVEDRMGSTISTMIHEVSHRMDRGNDLMTHSQYEYIKSLQNEENFDDSIREGYIDYVSNPTETKARLMAIRFAAKASGLDPVDFDLFDMTLKRHEYKKYKEETGNMHPSFLGNVSADDAIEELGYVYTEDQINEMLRNIW